MQRSASVPSLLPLLIATSALGGTLITPGYANEGSSAAESPVPSLEEVVVNAQKVTTNLQNIPIAVTAITASTLDQANVTSIQSLDAHVPGMVVNGAGVNPKVITIRGVGYEGYQNNSAQPGVSFNENGVYIADPVFLNFDFLNLERLEVIRGPQGTVLGQNSDGGAINIETVRPKLDAFAGSGDVSFGNYDLLRGRAAANIPVGDTFAIRTALQYEKHHGWAEATEVPGDPHYPLSDSSRFGGRVEALWQPTERLALELWGEHDRISDNSAALKNIFDTNPDPRRLTQDYPGKYDATSNIASVQLSYKPDWATLKLISSYQTASVDQPEDVDRWDFANAVRVYGVHDIIPYYHRDPRAWTQEFNITSTPGGVLDWIAGLFFLHQKNQQALIEFQQSQANLPMPVIFDPTPAQIGALFGDGLAFVSQDVEKHNSFSAYAQGTYDITDRLRFIGGARFTRDTSTGDVAVYFNPPVHLSTGFSAVTGKAELEYQLTPFSSVYGMWSSGVKPGGTNLNPGSTVVPSTFKHESVNALEIGSKNELFDRKVRVNFSAFYNFYDNYQIDAEDPIPYKGGMTNIPKTRTYGLEAEGSALLPHGFRFDGNFATTGGKVVSHFLMIDPIAAQEANRLYGIFTTQDLAARLAAQQDVYGKRPGKVPDFTTAVAVGHTYEFTGGVLTSRLQFLYRTHYMFRVYNNPGTDLVPDSRQWNLSFDFVPPGAHWHAEFLVTNLTDSNSVNARLADNFGVGEVTNEYIPPRQFILRTGVEF